MTSRVSGSPVLVSLLAKNGWAPREYVVFQMALVQAAMAFALKPANEPDEKYAAEVHVNPANLRFIREHQDSLKALGGNHTTSE